MANYFPLIVNAVTGKIEELPVGDNLDLLGSGLINVSNVANFTIGISNLHIPGGQNGNVLTTDGTGNLSWGVGGGGNVVAIPPVYFVAPTTGPGQSFTSSILSQYQSNVDLTLFRNGVLLENTQYTLVGDTVTINVNLNTSDTVEVIRQFVSSANIGGNPGGVNTQVQFNNAGAFGAVAEFTFDAANSALRAGNSVTANFFIGDGGLLSNIAGGANLSNGSSNIVIGDSSNITFSVGGNANVVDMGAGTVVVNQPFIASTTATIEGTLTLNTTEVSLGLGAASDFQGAYAIAIGSSAGTATQGENSISIGSLAGALSQSPDSVAIGSGAGQYNQGPSAVAIGLQAGSGTIANTVNGQSVGAIAIGSRAGVINQGENSIAIGTRAGINNQADNSIVLNASGANLNATTANSFVVKPVRQTTSTVSNLMTYDSTSGEISYANTGLVALNVTTVNQAAYTALVSDQVLTVSYNGTVTITLPNPVGIGSQILVKDILGAAGNRRATPITVTVGDTATQRIDGSTTFIINQAYAGYTFTGVSATQWIIT